MKLDPQDFQLQKTQVALMLARHEFTQAREQAAHVHRLIPDDVMTYGYIAEADIALGNCAEAETNAQWMLNLRANNIPGLLIGAELRSLYGDSHGAIQFLSLAYSETSPTEPEELAWIANRIASIQIESGQIDAAAQTLEAVAQVFHPYPYTIENLARVRMEQNRANNAVLLLRQATQIDANPDVVYQLARVQEAAGQSPEARATYAEFEKLASDPAKSTDEARRDLVLMYAANPVTAPKALTLAQKEIAARQDVWTLDAYAWALYANADFINADSAERKAIAVGVQSAQIFDHAGHIAQKLNQKADATKYFQLAIRTDPASEYSADALRFVSLPVVAEDDHQKAPPTEPTALQTDGLRDSAGPGQLKSNSAPLDVATPKEAPAFAPVAEALLTPKATSTDRLIHTAQGTVTNNPANAKAYAALGAAHFSARGRRAM